MAQPSEMHMRVEVDPDKLQEFEDAVRDFNKAVGEVHEAAARVRGAMGGLQYAFAVKAVNADG